MTDKEPNREWRRDFERSLPMWGWRLISFWDGERYRNKAVQRAWRYYCRGRRAERRAIEKGNGNDSV